MTTFEKLKTALQTVTDLKDVPFFYAHSKERTKPPYLAYLGTGQEVFEADNTHYYRENTYQIEYYFTRKDETIESAIEDALLGSGFLYEKSEDIFVEDEGVFMIYYYI